MVMKFLSRPIKLHHFFSYHISKIDDIEYHKTLHEILIKTGLHKIIAKEDGYILFF